MQSTGQVALRYTSSEYKYQQMILVFENERCPITQLTIKELYEANIKRGVVHVLALVHDEGRGQTIYDASALNETLVRNTSWEWKNPETNKKIKKIDFFALSTIADGYLLLRKVKMKNQNGQVYEDLWFCSNLSFATESDNPHVFHSIAAVICHLNQIRDFKQGAKWRYKCYQAVEQHFGKGIALLFLGYIIQSTKLIYLENFLFIDFKYTCFDDLLQNSKLDALISERQEDLFVSEKVEENYELVKTLFNDILQERSSLPGVKFAEVFFKSLEQEGFSYSELEGFASDTDLQIAHFAQAALCTFQNSYVKRYIENLTKIHPNWKFGAALLKSNGMENLSGDELTNCINILLEISKNTRDLLLLELLADRFNEFGVRSELWKSAENIWMHILSMSRFRQGPSTMYTNVIKKNGETQNALFLLENNFKIFNTYTSLADLSNLQRELGIKQIDKSLYMKGVENGLRVFANRSLHTRLVYPLGKDLVAEITPFKATTEQEAKGIEILREEFKLAPHIILLQMILNDYLIRKGSFIEARDAKQWIDGLKIEYSKDLNLQMSSVRGALRFAEKREDLLIVEEMIRECEKLGTSPTLFLLKALWQSHPLRRDTLPEWYILASVNFKKAFENADSQHVQFLLDHLSRYDKLVEEDQIKCRTTILELLGMG